MDHHRLTKQIPVGHREKQNKNNLYSEINKYRFLKNGSVKNSPFRLAPL
jgi:hypothetical protein